jgi:hypothetical protein
MQEQEAVGLFQPLLKGEHGGSQNCVITGGHFSIVTPTRFLSLEKKLKIKFSHFLSIAWGSLTELETQIIVATELHEFCCR